MGLHFTSSFEEENNPFSNMFYDNIAEVHLAIIKKKKCFHFASETLCAM